MEGNLLLGEMSRTGPENPQSGAQSLGSEESRGEGKADCSLCPPVGPPAWAGVLGLPGSTPWASWAPAAQLLVLGVPCWLQTRSGKPQMRMEQKLGTCCLAWCPELGHYRRGGTWGRNSFQQHPWWLWALPSCSCPGSFSGVQGSSSMLGRRPVQGTPGRAGGAQAMFPPAPRSLHDSW